MQKSNISFVVVGICALAALLIFNRAEIPFLNTQSSPSSTVAPANQQSEPELIPISVTIDFGGEKAVETVTQELHSETSALSALELLKAETVITKEYSFGKLVEGIDGVTNGTDNKYWLYSVNNQEASVGAAEYILQPNDQMLWEFKAYEQ